MARSLLIDVPIPGVGGGLLDDGAAGISELSESQLAKAVQAFRKHDAKAAILSGDRDLPHCTYQSQETFTIHHDTTLLGTR